jgi:hypothetical protein
MSPLLSASDTAEKCSGATIVTRGGEKARGDRKYVGFMPTGKIPGLDKMRFLYYNVLPTQPW